ncbi:unnamed protein product [Mytilus coruscus]|uniref:Sushi domain-containing protein n=1 Tax=Mytilus coruscus TaxID=42192 RepID=A0A6J8CT59_MYTCO|nr:unnamed protein product [Mytilus coruscus]
MSSYNVFSFSLDDLCDDDDVRCKYPQMSKPGEIIYGHCHRDVALRRLQRASFLTCLKECMRTANCTNIGYRRNWKLCDINGEPNSQQNLFQEDGCQFSNISTWSKKLAGKCAAHKCEEGYKCIPNQTSVSCELAYCSGNPDVTNATSKETFGIFRELGYAMMYGCNKGHKIRGRPFAVCQRSGTWKILFICGEGAIVSHRKTTGQSSIWQCLNSPYYCNSDAGVDGIKDVYNIFHTAAETRPVWWVDLQRVYKIHKVVLTNAMNSNANRLKKLEVHIEKSTSQKDLCGTHDFIGSATEGEVIEVKCPTLLEGQKVIVTMINEEPNFFHLTEVEVYGG